MSNASLLNGELLKRAREMRHEAAPAEQKLWRCLRNRQLDGMKFRRQHPMPPYVADFYCEEVSLVIELDGDSHAERELYDARRTRHLERAGCNVLRFLNGDVQQHLDAVLGEILRQYQSLTQRNHPHPNPLPQ